MSNPGLTGQGCPPRSEIGAHLSRFDALARSQAGSALGLAFGSIIRPAGSGDPEDLSVQYGVEFDWLLRYYPQCFTAGQIAKFDAARSAGSARLAAEAEFNVFEGWTGLIIRIAIGVLGAVLILVGLLMIGGEVTLQNVAEKFGTSIGKAVKA